MRIDLLYAGVEEELCAEIMANGHRGVSDGMLRRRKRHIKWLENDGSACAISVLIPVWVTVWVRPF